MNKRFYPYSIHLLIAIVSLPTVWALINPGFFPLHDYTHVARLAELTQAINDGHIPPRWSSNLGYGYGMPQFHFYAPLFYYIAYGIGLLGINYLEAIKVTLLITTFIGTYAFFYIGRLLFGKFPYGLLAAVIFLYAPYRAVDMYVRGAFSELLAISMLALVILSLVLVNRYKHISSWILYSISLALLFLSHNLITLISLPFILIGTLAVVFASRLPLWKAVVFGGLGVGLSAFYLFPAFMEKRYTQVQSLTGGFSDFHHHFLYLRQLWHSPWGYGGSIFGLNDDMSFELGKVFILLALFGSLWLVTRKQWKYLLLVSIMTITSVLLMTFKTQLIWETVPLMAYIQFPWRYLSITVVLIPLLAAPLINWFPKLYSLWLTAVLIIGIVTSYSWRFQPKSYLEDPELLYYSDPLSIQTRMSSVIPDFLPNFGTDLPTKPPSSRIEVIPETALESIHINRTHEFLAKLKPHSGALITVNIFYFPGWQLYLDGNPLMTAPDPLTGLIKASLPANHKESVLSGRFEDTPIRRFSNFFSILSLFVISGIWMWSTQKKRSHD